VPPCTVSTRGRIALKVVTLVCSIICLLVGRWGLVLGPVLLGSSVRSEFSLIRVSILYLSFYNGLIIFICLE
jgi:hypothetical protein